MEGGQVSLILTGMNSEVMTMIEHLPEIGQEEEIVSAQILPFSLGFENPWLLLSYTSAVPSPSERLLCRAGIKTKYKFKCIANWAVMRSFERDY